MSYSSAEKIYYDPGLLLCVISPIIKFNTICPTFSSERFNLDSPTLLPAPLPAINARPTCICLRRCCQNRHSTLEKQQKLGIGSNPLSLEGYLKSSLILLYSPWMSSKNVPTVPGTIQKQKSRCRPNLFPWLQLARFDAACAVLLAG
jgi:hypothetical protein